MIDNSTVSLGPMALTGALTIFVLLVWTRAYLPLTSEEERTRFQTRNSERKIIVSLSLYILCGGISGALCMMAIFSKVWHTRVGTLIVVGWFPLLCALYASSITVRVLLRRPAIIITGERVRVWQLFWYRDIPLSRLLGTKVVFSYISGATSLWLKVTRRVPVRVFANIPYSLILVATGTSEEDCATIAQKVDEARSERPA